MSDTQYLLCDITVCAIAILIVICIIFTDLSKQLSLIIKNQKNMSEALDALKAKVDSQNGKLDAISTSVTGIAADVAALKAKLGGLSGGATAEEIAEVSAMVDGVGSKIDTIGTATTDLDAQTDPANV